MPIRDPETDTVRGSCSAAGCTAIVLAAGRGSRMGGSTPKQYMLLGGKPLFVHSLETMEKSAVMTDIVLVVPEDDIEYVRALLDQNGPFRKIRRIAPGGSERYYSVNNGLEAIDWPCGYVFIQDGARPFLDEPTIERLYEAVRETGACVAGMPSKDTVKITDGEGFVESTPNRESVWIIQTPQVFRKDLITEAYREMIRALPELTEKGIRITDDAMVAEYMLHTKVKLVEASYRNIKVTTPEDLLIAEAFLRE